MEINLGNERIVELQAAFPPEMILERAMSKRVDAFGQIAKLFQRPKPDDIEITVMQKRYEPFWYCAASARYVYDRRDTFRIEVSPEVQSVTLFDREIMQDRTRGIEVAGIAHCVEEPRVEMTLDAVDGHECDFSKYLSFEKREVASLSELGADGAVVETPEVRGSFVVRKLTTSLVKTFQADRVLEERVDVDEIVLYFRPLYGVEYTWRAKQKKQIYEFDALTGEVKSEGGRLSKQVARVLENDTLFDIGADTVGMIVPGANIAIKLGRLAARKAVH